MSGPDTTPATGGTVIGALVYDPRPLTPEQEARIREIAEQAAEAVVLRMQTRPSPRRLRG